MSRATFLTHENFQNHAPRRVMARVLKKIRAFFNNGAFFSPRDFRGFLRIIAHFLRIGQLNYKLSQVFISVRFMDINWVKSVINGVNLVKIGHFG